MPKPDPHRERMLDVLSQFRVLLRSVREHYQRVEEGSGLGGAQLWALTQIAAHPGIRVGDLAHELAIHLSTASNLVGRLEELGLVSRTRVGRDQRVVQLAVTPRGRATLGTAPRPWVGVLQRALLELPPARLKALQHELAGLLGHMKLPNARAARSQPLSEMLSRRVRPAKR